ncbi:hypothetical protein ACRRTK_009699 [Alexandromys fortis]
MERVWYFGGIWCKVTEHGLADTGLALGDSGESNLISPLPGELGRMERGVSFWQMTTSLKDGWNLKGQGPAQYDARAEVLTKSPDSSHHATVTIKAVALLTGECYSGQECPKAAVSQDGDAHGAFVSKTGPERVRARNVDKGTHKERSIFLRPARHPADCYYLEGPYF